MKLGLINSAWLGTAVDTIRGIQLTKEIGFDTIDIFADPMEATPQELRSTREACINHSLPVISTVCCALGIADFNTSVRKFHIGVLTGGWLAVCEAGENHFGPEGFTLR